LIEEFVEHYLTERFHQGIGGQLIGNQPGSTNDNGTSGRIACRSRLGGLLNYYHRDAALSRSTSVRRYPALPGSTSPRER
jgi:hypothetical protein